MGRKVVGTRYKAVRKFVVPDEDEERCRFIREHGLEPEPWEGRHKPGDNVFVVIAERIFEGEEVVT